MKLIKCYVSSFGRLKDYTLDFNAGINVIKEDNGWGKSTLSVFIKSMFYGLKGSNKHSLSENERKKYKPWNSTEKFGGYIDFEKDEKVYRIERFFGNKDAEDELRVFDVKTGKPFSNTDNLGERIFGVDEDGFFSTTYFSEKDFEITGNTSLTAKYNSVCGVESSDAFDSAVLKIENKIKKYKIRGGKGLIEETRQEVRDVLEELEKSSRAVDTAKLLKNEIHELEEKAKVLQKEINVLGDKLAKASKVEAVAVKRKIYQDALKEKQRFESELSRIENAFNGYFPEIDEVKMYLDCYKDYLSVSSSIEKIRIEIEREDEKSKEKTTTSVPKTYFVILGIAVAMAVLGGVLVSLLLPVAIAMFTLSFFGVLAFVILFVKNPPIKKVENSLSNRDDALKETLKGYYKISDEYKQKINLFLSKFSVSGDDEFAKLQDLRDKVTERDLFVKNYSQIKLKVSEYEQDTDLKLDTELTESTDELSRVLKEKQSDLSATNRLIADKKASYSRIEEVTSAIPDLENKRAQLIERGVQYTEEYNLLTKTLEFLKSADENLKIKYREPLENSFNKYLSIISDGKIRKALVDVDFNVMVEENGVGKDYGFYSKGSQNLFDVCKRFALIDVLFTKEKPFMILDDPFVNFDDKKTVQALNLINNLSNDYQILYFTCHNSRKI